MQWIAFTRAAAALCQIFGETTQNYWLVKRVKFLGRNLWKKYIETGRRRRVRACATRGFYLYNHAAQRCLLCMCRWLEV